MTAQDFFDEWNGKPLNADGAYGNQCADVPIQYNKEVVGGGHFSGNAIDFQHNYDHSAYVWIENTPAGVPVRGDIVVWGLLISQYGHVAIFDHGDVNSFVSFDQNWPLQVDSNGNGTGVCHFQNHSYHGVLGWLHPNKDVNYVPAPVPAEVAEPAPVTVSEPDPAPAVIAPVPEESPEAPTVVVATPETLPTLPSPAVTDTLEKPEPSEEVSKVPWTGGEDFWDEMEKDVIAEFKNLTNSAMNAKEILTDLVKRLLSRKLWLTIVTAAYFAFHGDMNQATAVVMTYLGVNAFGPK